ncbi:HEAT repeat-containing protein [Toxoplasma gondii FOU]|uniref:HEAT repeat-containing protein n=1 Tax=Toxoplasma gondii FOU TaxID=943167 RepID=A0A086JVZ0_TOXGO|nr:HEAT repeat-containing protein [Toxoplasma gondii FOU]
MSAAPASSASGEAPNAASGIAEMEKKKKEYENTLLRLTLCNDDRLPAVLDKLLPIAFREMASCPAQLLPKVIEIVNHCLHRLRGTSSMRLPLSGLVDTWLEAQRRQTPGPNATVMKNVLLLFLSLAVARASVEEKLKAAEALLVGLPLFFPHTYAAAFVLFCECICNAETLSSLKEKAKALAANKEVKGVTFECLSKILAGAASSSSSKTPPATQAFVHASVEFLLLPPSLPQTLASLPSSSPPASATVSAACARVSGVSSDAAEAWMQRLRGKSREEMLSLQTHLVRFMIEVTRFAPLHVVEQQRQEAQRQEAQQREEAEATLGEWAKSGVSPGQLGAQPPACAVPAIMLAPLLVASCLPFDVLASPAETAIARLGVSVDRGDSVLLFFLFNLISSQPILPGSCESSSSPKPECLFSESSRPPPPAKLHAKVLQFLSSTREAASLLYWKHVLSVTMQVLLPPLLSSSSSSSSSSSASSASWSACRPEVKVKALQLLLSCVQRQAWFSEEAHSGASSLEGEGDFGEEGADEQNSEEFRKDEQGGEEEGRARSFTDKGEVSSDDRPHLQTSLLKHEDRRLRPLSPATEKRACALLQALLSLLTCYVRDTVSHWHKAREKGDPQSLHTELSPSVSSALATNPGVAPSATAAAAEAAQVKERNDLLLLTLEILATLTRVAPAYPLSSSCSSSFSSSSLGDSTRRWYGGRSAETLEAGTDSVDLPFDSSLSSASAVRFAFLHDGVLSLSSLVFLLLRDCAQSEKLWGEAARVSGEVPALKGGRGAARRSSASLPALVPALLQTIEGCGDWIARRREGEEREGRQRRAREEAERAGARRCGHASGRRERESATREPEDRREQARREASENWLASRVLEILDENTLFVRDPVAFADMETRENSSGAAARWRGLVGEKTRQPERAADAADADLEDAEETMVTARIRHALEQEIIRWSTRIFPPDHPAFRYRVSSQTRRREMRKRPLKQGRRKRDKKQERREDGEREKETSMTEARKRIEGGREGN